MPKPRLQLSALFAPALREVPKEATLASHRLLLRAGYMRQCAAGIYSLLPLAVRSLDKITSIINDEMAGIGAQRLAMPCMTPAALWKKSGRLDGAGEELIRFKDRKDTPFVLGPTHEEVITDLVGSMLTSHRQLPLLLYQLDRKFRDEARPRSGLLRCREFWMKDLYTFDGSRDEARSTYAAVCGAYSRIFARLGLKVVRAEADTGNIGGEISHEYHLTTTAGDDHVALCSACEYAANVEIAKSKPTRPSPSTQPAAANAASLNSLLHSLDLSAVASTALHVSLQEGPTPTLMVWPSTRKLSPIKARCQDRFTSHQPAAADSARELLASGRQITVKIDESLSTLLCGSASRSTLETANILLVDMTEVADGDGCPRPGCSGTLGLRRGLELGHAFLLGTKYALPMGATFVTREGVKNVPAEMGCYGIGVSRVLAAAAEAFHDDRGLALPLPVSPYRAVVVAQPATAKLAEEVFDQLVALPALRGETILDTSDRGLGEKMKLSELIGVPYTIVLGSRATNATDLEVHVRATGVKTRLSPAQLASTVEEELAKFGAV